MNGLVKLMSDWIGVLWVGALMLGAALSLFGCGIEIDHQMSGGVEVIHTINTDEIYNFFLNRCEGDRQCANQEMDDFLDWLYSTSGGQQ